MKKNLVSTLAIIAAATAVFGMTASADDVKTAEIVLEAENAPYTYEDDNGEPAGYEYEVLKLIDDYLDDWTFNYTVLDYETALAGTTSGKYDLDSGCKFRTPAREEAFLLSNPYNYFFMNLVVKNDSGIKSLEDMDGKSIAPIVATDGRAVALADWMEKHPDIKLDFETLAASGAMADEITSVEDGVYDAAYLSAEQATAILEETGHYRPCRRKRHRFPDQQGSDRASGGSQQSHRRSDRGRHFKQTDRGVLRGGQLRSSKRAGSSRLIKKEKITVTVHGRVSWTVLL